MANRTLRVTGNQLENVVEAGYGQSMHYDVKVLEYNAEENVFEGRVWDGRFGPDDNTTWLQIGYDEVIVQFGAEIAAQLARPAE